MNYGQVQANLKKKYGIKIKSNAVPTSLPPNRIPRKLRRRPKKELDWLCRLGIIEPVNEPQEWLNKLVIVEKEDGTLRLCPDPSDLNEAIIKDYCEIPTIEDLFSKVKDSKFYTVLDLKVSFWHVELTEESVQYTTFATCFGTFRFKRLPFPFGICIGSEVFQRYNVSIFGDIEGVEIY